jgi:DNA-binding NarL/FixJ family response regulator
MSSAAHSVFICETLPVVVEGLHRILEGCPALQIVGVANSHESALPLIESLQPQLVLLDQAGGLRQALQFINDLRRVAPNARAALWTATLAEVDSMRALQAGFRGILKRNARIETLIECLQAVADGNLWIENSISTQVTGFLNRRNTPRLTAREQEIVQLVCRGLKNRQIAEELHITPGTVKVHLMHVFEKTGAKDRYDLALRNRKSAEYDLTPVAGTKQEAVNG